MPVSALLVVLLARAFFPQPEARSYSPCGLGMMGVPGPGGPAEPGGPCTKFAEPQEIGTQRRAERRETYTKDVKTNSR